MIIPTCARCDRPFPANSDLAALPHGKRIAFDPELGRVWRICTKCGEWNLVGPDTAGTAADELRMRLPAIQPDAIVHDAVGSVDVITVCATPDAHTNTSQSLKYRRGGILFSRYARLASIAGAVLLGGPYVVSLIGATLPEILSLSATFSMTFASILMSGQIVRRIAGRAVVVNRVAMGGLLALIGAVAALNADPWVLKFYMFFPLILGANVIVDLVSARLQGKAIVCDDGTIVRVRHDDGERIWVGLDRGAVTVGNLRGRRTVSGEAFHQLIPAVGVYPLSMPTAGMYEQGWLILRRHHDLAGIMRALATLRPEDAGRHPYASLPPAWQIAMAFAVVEASGTDAERDAIREQIAAASEVAAIAESLDAGSGASRLKPRLGEPKH